MVPDGAGISQCDSHGHACGIPSSESRDDSGVVQKSALQDGRGGGGCMRAVDYGVHGAGQKRLSVTHK